MVDLELQINDFLLELRNSNEINKQAKKYLLDWFQSFQPQEF